jgi:hypothetical protein
VEVRNNIPEISAQAVINNAYAVANYTFFNFYFYLFVFILVWFLFNIIINIIIKTTIFNRKSIFFVEKSRGFTEITLKLMNIFVTLQLYKKLIFIKLV